MLGQDDPDTRLAMHVMHGSVVIKDKIYMMDFWDRTFFYSLSECKWGRGSPAKRQSPARTTRDWCVIDNLLYCLGNNGCVYWSELEELDYRDDGLAMKWTELVICSMASRTDEVSLSRMTRFGRKMASTHRVIIPLSKMINSGQNIVVFWKRIVDGEKVEIWCADFGLRKCKRTGKMIGEAVSSNAILTLSPVMDRANLLCSVSVDI